MTDDEIAAARALVDAATPGPWEASGLTISPVARIDHWLIEYRIAKIDHWPIEYRGNAAFIAASRSLVPKLIAEVERLRAVLANIAVPYPELVRGALDARPAKPFTGEGDE